MSGKRGTPARFPVEEGVGSITDQVTIQRDQYSMERAPFSTTQEYNSFCRNTKIKL
jgi:hypothetical protein